MLQSVMEHVHNMFIKSPNPGTYTIQDGAISPSNAFKEGQRIWIVGSDLNDGVYTYHESGINNDDDTEAAGLRDEVFSGSICALAVPPTVIALSEEIKQWVAKYGETMKSPYLSESVIGVYSYEKMTASKAENSNPNIGWKDMFKAELDRWRKVSF